MKYLLFLILLTTSTTGLAQIVINADGGSRRDSGGVIDARRHVPTVELEGRVVTREGNPVPYPIVRNIHYYYYLPGNSGTSNGCFRVKISPSSLLNTIISVSALGYYDTVVSPISLINRPEVRLREKPVNMEPLVDNDYQETEDLILGVTRKCKYFCNRAYFGRHPGYQVGIFINNEHNVPLRVSKVEAYIAKGGIPDAPLRLRIYRLDTTISHSYWGEIQTVAPGENLLLSQQIERVGHGGEWLIFDLEEANVYIPKEGALFALEYIYSGTEYYHGPYDASGSKRYGPDILISNDKKALPFFKTAFRWRKDPYTTLIGNRYRAPTIRVHCKKPMNIE